MQSSFLLYQRPGGRSARSRAAQAVVWQGEGPRHGGALMAHVPADLFFLRKQVFSHYSADHLPLLSLIRKGIPQAQGCWRWWNSISHLGHFWVKYQLLAILLNKANNKKENPVTDITQPNSEHITWIILQFFTKNL